MTLSDPRQSEIQKYEAVYKQPGYRMGPDRMAYAKELVQNERIKSYLDVSCGRGEMLEFAKSIGIPLVQGTEVVSYLYQKEDVTQANAWSLPFEDNSFECVSLFDVIEHLLPEDTNRTLEELKRVASKVIFFTAANYSASGGGIELHVNRKPYLEWNAILENIFKGCTIYWLERKYSVRNETWAIYL